MLFAARRTWGTPSAAILHPRLERGKGERWFHFFALRPVVVCVAFETARFRMIRTGSMARLACRNARNQDIARFRARQRFRMATGAGKPCVCVVIEFRMWQPAQRDVRR